jgi:DNA primase
MALPPGFLDELRGRTSLARVAARKLTWDARKTNAAKGDYWAACPFHQEKTASFHVDDRKGFYYCFGCHAKGDAIGFVKETENVGFMEAVAILAREAGMAIPAPDPAAQARADRRATLSDVMEEAVRFFRLQLKTGAARAARDYLTGRGLTDAALTRFEIGFAPDARQALWQHLTAKGIAPDSVVEAGLAARPDDGGPPYDRFRGRIQFPIRDARGRTIAFGGRALSETARAKYLNSPETPLFDKGRTLYHHGPAREAAGKGASLIVAEGYMDVIALVEAGFTGAVAPLGTAITEAQLDLLWRIAPEPIVALDGDTAGRRAAHRLVDLALPRLEPGRSLRFALLPAGQDPDDVIRAGGPTAMQQVLDRSETLVQTLINRETEGRDLRHAEARAEVNAALRGAAQKITHRDLRDQFWSEIKPVLAQIFDAARPARAGNRRRQRALDGGLPRRFEAAAPAAATKRSTIALAARDEDIERLREATILALCLAWPDLADAAAERLEALDCIAPDHAALLAAILRHAAPAAGDAEKLGAAVVRDCGTRPLENLRALGHLRVVPALLPGADRALARRTLDHEISGLVARRGARHEIDHAIEDADHIAGEGLTLRLREAAATLHGPAAPTADPAAEAEAERATLSAGLQALIDGEVWVKGKPAK